MDHNDTRLRIVALILVRRARTDYEKKVKKMLLFFIVFELERIGSQSVLPCGDTTTSFRWGAFKGRFDTGINISQITIILINMTINKMTSELLQVATKTLRRLWKKCLDRNLLWIPSTVFESENTEHVKTEDPTGLNRDSLRNIIKVVGNKKQGWRGKYAISRDEC